MMADEMFGASSGSEPSDDEDGECVTWADGEQLGPVVTDTRAGMVFAKALATPTLSSSPKDSSGCFPSARGLVRLQTLLAVSDNFVRAVTNGMHVKVGTFWKETRVVITFLRRFG